MPNSEVKNIITTMGSAARVNRLRAANYFLQNPDKFSDLLKLTFDMNFKLHYKAAWVLEFVLERHLDWILPFLDFYTKKIRLLKNQSAIRPTAKINKWIAIAYVKKKDKLFQDKLTNKHIELIIETGFDWMIGENKVAAQAYTMDTLYYFGSLAFDNLNWVHPELKNIIQQNINIRSVAYKAHGKKILHLLAN